MKYYKNTETSEVFAYENEAERQEWGAPELVKMTQREIDEHLNPAHDKNLVPQQVTRAQGKAALIQAVMWDDVLLYVDSIADPTEKSLALVALNDTTHWQRSSPFLNDAATALGLSSEDLDDLFINAAQIQL